MTSPKKKTVARSNGSTLIKASHSKRRALGGRKGCGRGEAQVLHAPRGFRGTCVQVCGLYPWATGGAPMEGVPFGRNLLTGEPVCCEPISWFLSLRLISTPSAFVMANSGLGNPPCCGARLWVWLPSASHP